MKVIYIYATVRMRDENKRRLSSSSRTFAHITLNIIMRALCAVQSSGQHACEMTRNNIDIYGGMFARNRFEESAVAALYARQQPRRAARRYARDIRQYSCYARRHHRRAPAAAFPSSRHRLPSSARVMLYARAGEYRIRHRRFSPANRIYEYQE